MSKKNHPSRLPAYTRVALGSITTASAIGTTDAAVVYFDVNPDQTIPNATGITFGNINLVTGTYSLNDSTTPSFLLGSSGSGPEFVGYQIEAAALGGYYTYQFAAGTPISGALTFTSAPGTPAYWGPGDSGYLGLRIDLGGGNYNYGWAQVSVADPASSITITGFAFEGEPNTPIEAGAVPEPSTYALLALAGLFGAAVWHQRRHQRGAAPALLQLAAGARGVARFRADRNS